MLVQAAPGWRGQDRSLASLAAPAPASWGEDVFFPRTFFPSLPNPHFSEVSLDASWTQMNDLNGTI